MQYRNCGSRSSGKERDNETGLDYFGARYYGSNMGRWMSPDWSPAPTPVPFADLTDPQSLNLYGYVRNNPATRFDLDGHREKVKGSEKDWYVQQLSKASGLQFKLSRKGNLSIVNRPKQLSAVQKEIARIIDDKSKTVTVDASNHRSDVVGGQFFGNGNQALDRSDIEKMSVKGGFTPESVVVHETVEAYEGAGKPATLGTYQAAHGVAVQFENLVRLGSGLAARETAPNVTVGNKAVVDFTFYRETITVTNGDVTNATSERIP